MRVEQDQGTHPRLLRKPTLGEVSATTGNTTEKKAKRPKGSRFVGPTQLDDDQKSQIRKALKEKRIGDEIGRQIFIGAVEYQISAFAHRLQGCIEPETGDKNGALEKKLQDIAEKARILSGLLRELPDVAKARATRELATQDELGRGYDERYLCALGYEIDRLERACNAASRDLEPATPLPDPTPNRELVAKLAAIFSECFEMVPTAEEGGSFRASLEILNKVTGLAIRHEPAFLAQVLAADTPEG